MIGRSRPPDGALGRTRPHRPEAPPGSNPPDRFRRDRSPPWEKARHWTWRSRVIQDSCSICDSTAVTDRTLGQVCPKTFPPTRSHSRGSECNGLDACAALHFIVVIGRGRPLLSATPSDQTSESTGYREARASESGGSRHDDRAISIAASNLHSGRLRRHRHRAIRKPRRTKIQLDPGS